MILIWLLAGVIAVVGALACGIGLIVSIPVASLFLVYAYRKLTNGVSCAADAVNVQDPVCASRARTGSLRIYAPSRSHP